MKAWWDKQDKKMKIFIVVAVVLVLASLGSQGV